MTKSQLRAFAKTHNISLAEAREQIKKDTFSNQPTATITAIIRDAQTGEVEVMSGIAPVPTKARISRADALGNICDTGVWGHNCDYLELVGQYVSYSPALKAKRDGVQSKIFAGRVGIHHIDLDDLGCVIEFTRNKTDGTYGTDGCLWMSSADAKQAGEDFLNEHKELDVRRNYVA